jgi:hypothetical protein
MEAPGASKNGDAVGGRTNYGKIQQGSLEYVVNMVSTYKLMTASHVKMHATNALQNIVDERVACQDLCY